MAMTFHPKALFVTAVFLVLLWIALEWRLGLVVIALEAVLGWGLWYFIPDEWFAPFQPRRSRRPH